MEKSFLHTITTVIASLPSLRAQRSEARQSHERNRHCEARSNLIKSKVNNKQIAILRLRSVQASFVLAMTNIEKHSHTIITVIASLPSLRAQRSEARQSHERNRHCEARSNLMKSKLNNKQIAILRLRSVQASFVLAMTSIEKYSHTIITVIPSLPSLRA